MAQTLKKQLDGFKKWKTVTITTPLLHMHRPQEKEAYVHSDLHMTVHRSFICNSPKLETIHMSINR